jgi:hypothetical protein
MNSQNFGSHSPLTWAAWSKAFGGPWRLLASGTTRAEVIAKVPRDFRGTLRILPSCDLPVRRPAGPTGSTNGKRA